VRSERNPMGCPDRPARGPEHVAIKAAGLSASELAGKVSRHGSIGAQALRRWLLDTGLAVERGGLLAPTKLTVELAEWT